MVNTLNNNITTNKVKEADDVEEYMLTTLDNPYNPFTHYEQWYSFDVTHGYNCCSMLAAVASHSDELSELDQKLAINEAIETILRLNVLGIYIKVTAATFKDRSGDVNINV